MTGRPPEQVAAARRLGEALRGLQQRSGHTLRALETQVRISDSSLSRYFRGQSVPPWPVVRDLCRSMGADPGEYRALWEAAGRTDSADEPAVDDTPGTSPPPAPTWRHRLRTHLSGRWALAAAGAAIGLAAGLLLTLLDVRHSPATPPAHAAAAGPQGTTTGYGSAGVLVHNAQEDCQKPRTHQCALSLAYDPYRPYVTANAADRVWHHDLLQARCRIADGVTVTDEKKKHTSIWIQVTRNGRHLWLPGIRVDPDSLNQLSVVLPRCPS
ncbi:transcriptional regulator with XRE-family HTH domain [Streptomyces sp. 3330]|uniref:helix-turn-helix domain-containing protein n=1 Tax=Streptomyces sp. 3330 TaxID=2817755 RepID=UPI0028679DBB|nr:helix-turn-helix transcriptional regulator [Streptomyces sp. 3330]MDR6979050.1 transcriptional regulator with XRE-family HTH domain [Streptomyces sp. 3330]